MLKRLKLHLFSVSVAALVKVFEGAVFVINKLSLSTMYLQIKALFSAHKRVCKNNELTAPTNFNLIKLIFLNRR